MLSRSSDILLPVVAALLTCAPVGPLALILLMLLAADTAVVLIIARLIADRPKAVDDPVVILDAETPVRLSRRITPDLRARRPMGVVELQVRWRQAAEAHRRSRRQG